MHKAESAPFPYPSLLILDAFAMVSIAGLMQSQWLECHLDLVILNEVKNLADTDTLGIVRTPRAYDRDEILHFVQNDKT